MIGAKRKFKTLEIGEGIIRGINESLPELKMVDAIIKDIDEIDPLTPEMLIDSITRLATLSFRIGEKVNHLITQANEAYVYRKFRYAWEFSLLSGSVKDRESEALDNLFNEHQVELTTRFIADHFKTKLEMIDRLISVLQTRLRFAEKEWIKSNSI